jgi:hypothetical protein
VAGLALATPAVAGQNASLPSPLAPLSPSPPLGAATASAEAVRHRVASIVQVHVSVSPTGKAFAVAADQSLSVRVQGDYFFTIGAPLLGVTALPGSGSTPGFRSTAIIWQGFNPQQRLLRSRATLDPALVAPLLPLRIEVSDGVTTFVNTTGVTAGTYTADADSAPLVAYANALQRAVRLGRQLPAGSATLTSKPVATRVRVVAPLLVRGTVGGRRVSAIVTGQLAVAARGKIDVLVEPTFVPIGTVAASTGRAALAQATKLALTAARLRQYERFLDNPDPTGPATTIYLYRSALPPAPVATVRAAAHGRDWAITIAVAAGVLLAAAGGLAVWARA